MAGLGRITGKSKIAIVGGGPAGTFFALYLLHFAEERDVHPEITIFEQRDFDELGIKGCKGCAGILSLTFNNNLKELGLTIPAEIVQNNIKQYTVHSPYTSISMSNPRKETQIVSIYRGGGPRISHYEKSISFNSWLLREAQNRGVKVEDQSVTDMHLESGAWVEVPAWSKEYDLVVLASGINARQIRISGVHYIPPETQTMSQAELYAGAENVESSLDNMAHVVLIPHSRFIFGTLVPKGPFINVSVLSRSDTPFPVKEFLDLKLVRNILPEKFEYSCSCHPRVVNGMAKNFFANRFVVIGDAAISRLYKDGIGSSLLTAREAARTVTYFGLSRRSFERQYYPLCRNINRGNRWGRLLFSLNDRFKDSRVFLLAQNRIIGNEQRNIRGSQPFTKAAWGMFSGSYDYGSIAWMTLNPVSLFKLLVASVLEGLGVPFQKKEKHSRKLFVGSKKVLILGSGFGGTYVFRHLLPSLNKNENVETTMVSDENFFLFSPLLHEVAMGKIETRHIAFPIRRLHWRDRFNFVQDKVVSIDLQARKVITASGAFEFDYLVLALGSVPDTAKLELKNNNIFTLKTLRDSMLIRNHVIENFERATSETDQEAQRRLLTFVVCGAGYTGVQVVTELRDFIYRHLIRCYRTLNPANIKVVLVDTESRMLARLPRKLGAYAMRQLVNMDIDFRLGSRVTGVRNGEIEINNTEYVSTNTVIWVAGILANPCIAELEIKKDEIGRVLVNSYMEVPGAPGVYALGDCAHYEDTLSGKPIPPRAHTTVRQARVVAHNILAEIRGWDKKSYHYSNNAEMVSLGASKAVFRFHKIKIYGFPARLIWIAGYSFLVTGLYNRVRIITDWGLSNLFGRDTTFLKLNR